MAQQQNQSNVTYPILTTKLYIPEFKPDLVKRKRLISRMNKGIDKNLMLISAPAGFGKTTLLSEWISHCDLPVAWISVHSSDSDPLCFIQYFIAALKGIEPDFGDDILEILSSPNTLEIDTIILYLIKEIETFPDKFILVLDDYHLINTLAINRLMKLILNHMPHQMCLALATRADPGFPLSRMRVKNQLTEIRISDLYFTKNETALFFSKVIQLDLPEKYIKILSSRTEGWIAGLQLVALSLKGREDVDEFIVNFAGSDRLVADYLAEEVLRRQPENIQHFLIKTSILNRLSEPLCGYVTGQDDSQKVLENIEQENLFLVPLDNKRHWYRYHHLFADLLRQKLQQNDYDTLALNIRARDWYQANGFIEEAIEHSLEAKEHTWAAEQIENIFAESWQPGEHAAVLKWLEVLPETDIFLQPNLCIFHASILFERGEHDAAETILDRLEISIDNSLKDSDDKTQLDKHHAVGFDLDAVLGRISALRAYWATLKGDFDNIAHYSQKALEQLPQNDTAWRMSVVFGAAITHEAKGDINAALDIYYEAAHTAKKAGITYFHMMIRVWLVILLNIKGQLPQAVEIGQKLLKDIQDVKLPLNSVKGYVFGIWAELIYEQNKLDESQRYAEEGIALLEKWHDIHHIGWNYACLGKILCSKNDIDGLKKLIPKIEALLETKATPPWVKSSIEAVRARIWLMTNDTKAIERWADKIMIEPDITLNRFYEAKYIELARILLHFNRYDEAEKIITPLLENQEKDKRGLHQMETLMLQARLFQITNRTDDAVNSLYKAISIAGPGGYYRVFTDEDQLVSTLLEQFSDKQKENQRHFIMNLQAQLAKSKPTRTAPGMIEPLSDRELDVLSLISAGLSNKKSAESLFISVNTLKTHLQNIYGKLGVHNRTEAVFRAKELNLID
ncbi:MAG: LuxR C-terminal-related transcriptional regulator [Desulfobacterales bacterium]|nr:LuxR C-terminal-related transcriptional regulator [Desulfobacterales bacterium]